MTNLPDFEYPKVDWVRPGYALWTFSTTDRVEQYRQFGYWCGWFGFSEDDLPDRLEGDRWWIRASL